VKFGVVVFPGTWSDRDCGWVIDQVVGAELQYLWHKDTDLKGCDCVILPGGFAYGDYLRTGAIARFAPLMEEIGEFADRGGLVWGICNGFQILCEAGLLPGDRWCVTALNWLRAHHDGCAAPVVLASTHERTLEVVPLEALQEHQVDVPDDLANL